MGQVYSSGVEVGARVEGPRNDAHGQRRRALQQLVTLLGPAPRVVTYGDVTRQPVHLGHLDGCVAEQGGVDGTRAKGLGG
jgi:hypothetical protein